MTFGRRHEVARDEPLQSVRPDHVPERAGAASFSSWLSLVGRDRWFRALAAAHDGLRSRSCLSISCLLDRMRGRIRGNRSGRWRLTGRLDGIHRRERGRRLRGRHRRIDARFVTACRLRRPRCGDRKVTTRSNPHEGGDPKSDSDACQRRQSSALARYAKRTVVLQIDRVVFDRVGEEGIVQAVGARDPRLRESCRVRVHPPPSRARTARSMGAIWLI
jgi:hypothetical protein